MLRQTLRKIPFARTAKHYAELGQLLLGFGRVILKSHPDVRMQKLFMSQFKLFVGSLQSQELQAFSKSTADSKASYSAYDDRDIRDYENGEHLMLINNELKLTTCKMQHELCMAALFEQIDPIVATKDNITILEVRAGNCLNIASLIARYGDKILISGIDIAENRIRIGQDRLGEKISAARLSAQSITDRTSFSDGEFDVVYSVHCLEQIAYDTKNALREMNRICRGKIVMLEPVFENGTALQRLYLILADHVRMLLKSIHELGLPLVHNEILSLQANPANQTSVLVIDKLAQDASTVRT